MPTQKRTRPPQRGRDPRAAAMARRRKEEQRKRIAIVVFTAVVVVLGVSVIVSTGGGNNQTAESGNSTTTVAVRQPVTLSSVPPGATVAGDTPCPKADGSSARTTIFAKPPPLSCITVSKSYTAEVMTSKGRFVIQLDPKAAPNTVNNFVVLSRYHFYDGIPFHRIIPGFVVQGGDPSASGIGGPGYRFDDELPRSGSYKVGSVAMANSGPNTNGSQFFVVTGDAGINLPLSYSLFGTVTEGMDVLKAIEAVGTAPSAADPQGGAPTEIVTITSVTVKES
ncbi:MAG: peptidylprolyl isomerase [Acidimicrobiales bacterium]